MNSDFPSEINQDKQELLKLYIGDLKGLKAIGKEIHSDPRTFKEKITSLGIKVPFPGSIWCKVSQHFNGQFFKPLPMWLEEVIIGSLLGDAQIRLQSKVRAHNNNPSIFEYEAVLMSISKLRKRVSEGKQMTKVEVQYWNSAIDLIKQTNTANFRLHKSILELDWINLLRKKFESFFKVTPFINKANNKTTKWTCGFDTSSSVNLFDTWKNWYFLKNNKTTKRIPILSPLTPNILLHWYIGDGYFSRGDMSICTHAFSNDEQKSLVIYLNTVGIKSTIRHKRNYRYVGISLEKENKERFFDFISRSKLYEEATKLFPYKFSNKITKSEWKESIFNEKPEYFLQGNDIHKKLEKKMNISEK